MSPWGPGLGTFPIGPLPFLEATGVKTMGFGVQVHLTPGELLHLFKSLLHRM